MTTQFQNYANLIAPILLANTTGSTPQIPNSLATGDLDTAIIQDPVKIEAYKKTVADQMNAQSGSANFTDLSDRVQDLIITTTAQGAATLEVHLVDPLLTLLWSGFIQADTSGYLWPPIDINFPTGTDCVWRLCQCRFTNDLTGANLILTFEDRIVSLLRQFGPGNDGIRQGQPNQTLGGFIKELVDNTNSTLRPNPPIRLLELIDPQDPNYTAPITSTPSSAITGQLRANPNRNKQGLTAVQQAVVTGIDKIVAKVFPKPASAPGLSKVAVTLQEIEENATNLLQVSPAGNPYYQNPGQTAGGNPYYPTP